MWFFWRSMLYESVLQGEREENIDMSFAPKAFLPFLEQLQAELRTDNRATQYDKVKELLLSSEFQMLKYSSEFQKLFNNMICNRYISHKTLQLIMRELPRGIVDPTGQLYKTLYRTRTTKMQGGKKVKRKELENVTKIDVALLVIALLAILISVILGTGEGLLPIVAVFMIYLSYLFTRHAHMKSKTVVLFLRCLLVFCIIVFTRYETPYATGNNEQTGLVQVETTKQDFATDSDFEKVIGDKLYLYDTNEKVYTIYNSSLVEEEKLTLPGHIMTSNDDMIFFNGTYYYTNRDNQGSFDVRVGKEGKSIMHTQVEEDDITYDRLTQSFFMSDEDELYLINAFQYELRIYRVTKSQCHLYREISIDNGFQKGWIQGQYFLFIDSTGKAVNRYDLLNNELTTLLSVKENYQPVIMNILWCGNVTVILDRNGITMLDGHDNVRELNTKFVTSIMEYDNSHFIYLDQNGLNVYDIVKMNQIDTVPLSFSEPMYDANCLAFEDFLIIKSNGDYTAIRISIDE